MTEKPKSCQCCGKSKSVKLRLVALMDFGARWACAACRKQIGEHAIESQHLTLLPAE